MGVEGGKQEMGGGEAAQLLLAGQFWDNVVDWLVITLRKDMLGSSDCKDAGLLYHGGAR